MSSVPPSQVGDASRVALARLALDVVSKMSGVAGTDAGPGGLCVTADLPFGVLQGVSVVAQPDGRYEVDLCLVARMVPLLALGDEIRRQLRIHAARAGLAARLGTVNVEFARALSADETLQATPGPEVAEGAEAHQGAAGARSSPGMSTDTGVPPFPAAAPSAFPETPPPGPTISPAAPPPAPVPPPTTPAPPAGSTQTSPSPDREPEP